MFLEGIKVLDVGSYVAAPAAATVMSDFGADVIKLEPLDGDPYRNLLGMVTTAYPNFGLFAEGLIGLGGDRPYDHGIGVGLRFNY